MQVEIEVKVNGALVKRLVETVDGTLEEMEETVDALSRKVASQTLQASVDAVEVPRPFFSPEGGRLRHKGYQTRTLVGLNGDVVVRRARFQDVQTGKMVFPLDERLDLPSGDVTVSLATRALRLGTYMSFAPLQEELRFQHDVRLSRSTLDRLMQTVGGVSEQDRQNCTDALVAMPVGTAREDQVAVDLSGPLPDRLYVSCDGVMYPTRYRQPDPNGGDGKRIAYQEMKGGTVYWETPDGRLEKRMLGGRDDPERFGLSLWALAVRCGMLQVREVVFISDGGTWCETVARRYFRDATRILDWYHLSEYVWEAGRALYTDEEATKRWVSTCLVTLKTSCGLGLLRHLKRSRRVRVGQGASDLTALDALIKYLEPRLAMTDYVDYRLAGFDIGSGKMEATCKQLVSGRLKGSGRQWSESGAVAMVALIAPRINGTWDQFWATRPLQRAA